MASEVSRFDTFIDSYLWGHMKSLIYETQRSQEFDLAGRIVDAAGLIADNPRIFDRVRESVLHIGTRSQFTCRVDILNNYCKFDSVIKCMS